MTLLLVILATISGTRVRRASAQDARRGIITFFDAHLKG
jgi:hypothetical protein